MSGRRPTTSNLEALEPLRSEQLTEPGSWDETRRRQARLGLDMTPAERLRWLEETLDEMRRLQGLARASREDEPSNET
jgi:hypothetical protein